MEIPSDKDFSREKQAFATYLENRSRGDSVEENDNSRNDNAELVEKFEKFLKMEELLKQGFGKRGHHAYHCYHHGHWRNKHLATPGENKEIEEYLKFCKHSKHVHKHGHYWGKGPGRHGHHAMFGKQHGHGFGRHGHGKHGRHGKHGHHHFAHGPWEGKHFWSMLAMYNELPEAGNEEASRGVNENARNPLVPPQESITDDGGKTANCARCEYKRQNRHGYCIKRLKQHSHKTPQTNATSIITAGSSSQSDAVFNTEAPANLVSMVENISIDNSPRARVATE